MGGGERRGKRHICWAELPSLMARGWSPRACCARFPAAEIFPSTFNFQSTVMGFSCKVARAGRRSKMRFLAVFVIGAWNSPHCFISFAVPLSSLPPALSISGSSSGVPGITVLIKTRPLVHCIVTNPISSLPPHLCSLPPHLPPGNVAYCRCCCR